MKYQAIAVVTLGVGAVLGLTEAQAAARKASTTPIPGRKGMFLTTAQVQFKRGEEFLYEGELPRVLADALDWDGKDEEEQKESKSARKARLKAEAKAKAEASSAGDGEQPEQPE